LAAVVVDPPPAIETVAPTMAPPPEVLVTVPLTEPVVGVAVGLAPGEAVGLALGEPVGDGVAATALLAMLAEQMTREPPSLAAVARRRRRIPRHPGQCRRGNGTSFGRDLDPGPFVRRLRRERGLMLSGGRRDRACRSVDNEVQGWLDFATTLR
jgi:hypothetical protein